MKVLTRLFVCYLLLLTAPACSHAQATPAATKGGDLKVGAGLVLAHPDYSPKNEAGFNVFAEYDFLNHFGAEFRVNRVGGSSATSVSETSYVAGARFLWTFYPYIPALGRHPITPFLNIGAGAGSFSFQDRTDQNGSYGLYVGGGGVDYAATRKFDVRLAYEYQRWASFIPNGLQPNLFTLGFAYHIR